MATEMADGIIRLDADATGVQAGFADAGQAVKGFERKLEDTGRAVNNFTAGLRTISYASAGVITSVAAITANFARQAKEADEFASRIGATAESYSRLRATFDLAGGSSQALERGMIKLSEAIAKDDGAFKALGISTRDSIGQMRGADTVFTDLVGKFTRMKDGVGEAALAQRLFGDASGAMLPILNQGTERVSELAAQAERLGLVIGTDASNAAKEFDRNMNLVTATLTGLRNELGGGLLPLVNDFLGKLRAAGNSSWLGFAITSGDEEKKAGAELEEVRKKIERLNATRDKLDPGKSFANKINDIVFGDIADLDKGIKLLTEKESYLVKLLETRR